MNVIFQNHRQVEVEYVANADDVDTASGNVGGNQALHHAVLEVTKRAVTRRLLHVTVQGSGGQTEVGQFNRQHFGVAACCGEHNGLIYRGVSQQLEQNGFLVFHVVAEVQTLRDVLMLGLLRADLQAFWIAHDTRCQGCNAIFQRGREQQCLAFGRRLFGNQFNVIDEAEVEHAVCFVEDQQFNAIQRDLATVHQIEQAARCGNHNINWAHQRFLLLLVVHAAEDADGTGLQALAVNHGSGFDLASEFTRWG